MPHLLTSDEYNQDFMYELSSSEETSSIIDEESQSSSIQSKNASFNLNENITIEFNNNDSVIENDNNNNNIELTTKNNFFKKSTNEEIVISEFIEEQQYTSFLNDQNKNEKYSISQFSDDDITSILNKSDNNLSNLAIIQRMMHMIHHPKDIKWHMAESDPSNYFMAKYGFVFEESLGLDDQVGHSRAKPGILCLNGMELTIQMLFFWFLGFYFK